MRVLFVDDEPSIVEAVGSVLRDLGHEVTGAADGEEALRSCEEAVYDLVITDIRMPRMDGMQLLRALRERGQQTPVILISGHRDEDATVTPGPGVAYLRKPMRLRELLSCIDAVTGATGTQ